MNKYNKSDDSSQTALSPSKDFFVPFMCLYMHITGAVLSTASLEAGEVQAPALRYQRSQL